MCQHNKDAQVYIHSIYNICIFLMEPVVLSCDRSGINQYLQTESHKVCSLCWELRHYTVLCAVSITFLILVVMFIQCHTDGCYYIIKLDDYLFLW